MEALYWEAPDPQKMAGSGVRPEDHKRPEVELWPENKPALDLYSRIVTQWRVGAGGPVGLDYAVVYREMDDLGLAGEEREEMKAAIRVIEGAALRTMRDRD